MKMTDLKCAAVLAAKKPLTRFLGTWKGKSDLSELAGQPIRLRFVLRDMKLYALKFAS